MSESGTPAPHTKTVASVPDVPPASPPEDTDDDVKDTPQEPSKEATGEDKWDPETKKYIQNLRKENAKLRTGNKKLQNNFQDLETKVNKISAAVTGKELPEDDPKVQLEQLKLENENLEAEKAIYESALEYGIPSDKVSYFKFLVAEKLGTMGEDEDELDVGPIAQQVLSMGGTAPPKQTGANTGTNPPKTGTPGHSDDVTVKQFREMGYLEKSKLQRTDPEKYEKLKTAALKN